MTLAEFGQRIEDNAKFTMLGVIANEVYVLTAEFGNYEKTEWVLPVQTILKQSWRDLEDVLMRRRTPTIMEGYSRVVGYYSRIRNWNKSKHAELRDRQAGAYDVTGIELLLPDPMAPEIAQLKVMAGSSEYACEVKARRESEDAGHA